MQAPGWGEEKGNSPRLSYPAGPKAKLRARTEAVEREAEVNGDK